MEEYKCMYFGSALLFVQTCIQLQNSQIQFMIGCARAALQFLHFIPVFIIFQWNNVSALFTATSASAQNEFGPNAIVLASNQ